MHPEVSFSLRSHPTGLPQILGGGGGERLGSSGFTRYEGGLEHATEEKPQDLTLVSQSAIIGFLHNCSGHISDNLRLHFKPWVLEIHSEVSGSQPTTQNPRHQEDRRTEPRARSARLKPKMLVTLLTYVGKQRN